MKENRIRITIEATKDLIATLDQLIDEGIYTSRSDAIRDMIRKSKLQPASNLLVPNKAKASANPEVRRNDKN